MSTIVKILFALSVLTIGNGCVVPQAVPTTEANSPLTHGNVQLTLKKGVTTQQEVLEKFGAPNIVTHDSAGQEVWTYQRHATVAQSNSSSTYATIILFGGSSRSSGFEQSQKTMTLIIKFDANKMVSDFKSMYSSF
ncbi:MAG: hypothetical protein DWQ09_04960 [Proteobacteria bacterium]|nr:MAG: hypothetical protein DWQ09_04960 [Pseudomonadota bacterium]QKK11311.1 MAG: hypothetical protein HND59_06625 [Pseudomonadota bacterium]